MAAALAIVAAFALMGVAVVLRPRLMYRFTMWKGSLDPDDFPFTDRRERWYRRSSVAFFAVAAVLLGATIAEYR